ncbi:MAG: hypothetical protein A2161_10795 [Candidatus Schekmanbacteria bacterium RBG_13_48_7]|uniref:PilZ domain-containing protein n=1 Tax=Candidatus Schekmanbacteria bacterium RBG_13_48_7 TaxID=1817878 RepID=A0A1F7RPQ2_9BACT|nr:MAG: hypothetical protein A2161_10795 [Candidatus Schekmanbacteria bacterium RBG_13_48_7]
MPAFFAKMFSFRSSNLKCNISGDNQLRDHFQILCHQNIPCYLFVEGKYSGDIVAEFQSCFIKVDKNSVIIDNLIPNHGNTLLDKIETWQIRYSCNGIHYSFKTHLNKHQNNSTILLEFPFPKLVSGNLFNPDEDFYPTPSKPIFAYFVFNQTKIISGEVMSINNHQISIQFKNGMPRFSQNQIIPSVEIAFPNQEKVIVNLLLRGILKNRITANLKFRNPEDKENFLTQLGKY